MKTAASEEMINVRKDDEFETCEGVSGAKMRFLGVDKLEDKWRARVRNWLLGGEEAEIEDTYKGQDSLRKRSKGSRSQSRRGCFYRKKLPNGVTMQNGRYRVRVMDPKSKKRFSCGGYKTLEDAVKAADRKRAEFSEMYGWKPRTTTIPNNEGSDEEAASKSDYLAEEEAGDVMVPPGVCRRKSGRWAARIKKPDSKDRIWLGTYDTVEEAISCYNKKKAEFEAKLKRPEFDCVELRPGSEATETPMKLERGFGYDRPSVSTFDLKSVNNVAVAVAVGVSDERFGSEFERAVSLGIINEYGQLLGEFRELDEFMGLSLPEENVTTFC